MKLTPQQLRRTIYFAIYRLVRYDLVARMRANGHTWTKINGVLRVLGQKQIVKVEYNKTDQKMNLTYADVALKEKRVRDGGKGWKKIFVEPVPEVTGNKPKAL